jgi:tetratricopeptide (TPR) repeat protein
MTKLARLPINEGALGTAVASFRRVPRARPRYFAFLSYSHKDEEIADWLHRELEEFRVPTALAGKLTANGVTPKRLTPIFRDEHELAAADDLSEEIEEALAASQFLIVLCSPNAAKSRWTNAEIEVFKRTRPDGCVLAAIAAGEPFASDIPGTEDEECFPPALRQKYDRRGRPTGKRAEPLAADLREEGDGRRLGFLKLVAGMLGVGLDDLVQRETTRRHRRLAWLTAASLCGMAVTSTLAFTAIQARDAARDQRREAEGLVAFMLGDLKDKLEPIGRLDALDGVGSRVLAYYSKQDTSQLSDAGLLQRSRALNLMGQVSFQRGNLADAARLYQEALAGTSVAIRRNPSDPKRLFDHAQNHFALGEIARQRSDLAAAETAFREYKRVALQMIALEPDSIRWRMENQYADANLGIVLMGQRRFREASAQFEQALRTIDALATAEPANREYQESVAETLAWLADARLSEGQLDQAIAYRRRQIALLERLLDQSRADVGYRLKLIPARRSLGTVYGWQGQHDAAISELRTAVDLGGGLVAAEPNNMLWIEYAANAHLDLADQYLDAQRIDAARGSTEAGCGLAERLVSRDQSVMQWRASLRACSIVRAQLIAKAGAPAEALRMAQQAVATSKSVRTNDAVSDRFKLARAYRTLGDIQLSAKNRSAARMAWEQALSALPRGVAERPFEISERQKILQRLGRPEARRVAKALVAMGYGGES